MLTEQELLRYSRQLVVPGFGLEGQVRLKAAKVLIIGTGGLGSPVAYYLSAAGIGTLGLVDADRVELSNLQRQILHSETALDKMKVLSAAGRLHQLNRDLVINTYPLRVSEANVERLLAPYDLVVDAVDSLETRFVVNDACVRLNKPLVEAGVSQMTGMVMTILPGQSPCYRCVFPQLPPVGSLPTPAQLGVVGSAAGLVGCIQATEAIKLLLGLGDCLAGKMLWIDLLRMSFETVPIQRDAACPGCGSKS